MGNGRGCGEQNGKRRTVEAKGKGHRQQKEIMGKGRGCVEEGWEEESSRRGGREGSQAEKELMKGEAVVRKNGNRRAVEGVERKGHRQ
jgi:hypothetical protein